MKDKKKNLFIEILRAIAFGVLVIILIMNVWIMAQAKSKPDKVPSVFGYKPFIVLSGSMESKIYAGDLVIVKETDTNELKVNDIIAFRDDENLVTTHRIVNTVQTDKGVCYETKGDNNNTKDKGTVCPEKVEGIYVSKIAKVGRAILFIQEPLGFIVMMLTIFIVCLVIYMISNRKSKISDKELKEFEEFKKAKKQHDKSKK